MEDVIKPIKLPLTSSWGLFQYCVVEKMGCHETLLKLGYKLSTEKAMVKPHSLKTLDEYEGMKGDFLLELKREMALFRKKMRKSSKTTPIHRTLKVPIMEHR